MDGLFNAMLGMIEQLARERGLLHFRVLQRQTKRGDLVITLIVPQGAVIADHDCALALKRLRKAQRVVEDERGSPSSLSSRWLSRRKSSCL